MASADEWTLTVRGRQTHGSRPWDGVDPITIGAQILLGTQSIIARQVNIAATPVVLTAGQFQSGVRFNIIPDEAKLVGTLRTFDPVVREDVIARFRRTAEDFAHAGGGSAELQVVNNAPATVNDPVLAQRARTSLENALGAGKVVEMPLVTVAEDFSQYATAAPTFFFFVGSTAAGTDPATAPINHSPRFVLDEQSLQVGSRAMLQVALDYLGQADALTITSATNETCLGGSQGEGVITAIASPRPHRMSRVSQQANRQMTRRHQQRLDDARPFIAKREPSCAPGTGPRPSPAPPSTGWRQRPGIPRRRRRWSRS